MNEANRPSETEEALARFVAQKFGEAPRLQASAQLWERIEADLLPSLAAPRSLGTSSGTAAERPQGNMPDNSDQALAEEKPQIVRTQLGLSDAFEGEPPLSKASAWRFEREAAPAWFQGFFSLAAMLVLLALPWALAQWPSLVPGGLDAALDQAHRSTSAASGTASPTDFSVGGRPSFAQDWASPTETSEQAFDDDTLTWLASLGEVTEEISY